LLPETVLNDVIEVEESKPITRFSNWPLGDLPRLVSLNECVNKNLMICVNRHISAKKQINRGPGVATDLKYEFSDVKSKSWVLLQ
jgi:hypothetical protein